VPHLTLINACCGGDPDLDSYAEFLRRRLAGRAEVELLSLGSCNDAGETVEIPPALREQLLGQQIDGIPIIVLDGKVLASGPLPNWMDSAEMIEAAVGVESAFSDGAATP
jgi:hypothetical protein